VKSDAKTMFGDQIVDDLVAEHEAALKAELADDIDTHDMLVARMT